MWKTDVCLAAIVLVMHRTQWSVRSAYLWPAPKFVVCSGSGSTTLYISINIRIRITFEQYGFFYIEIVLFTCHHVFCNYIDLKYHKSSTFNDKTCQINIFIIILYIMLYSQCCLYFFVIILLEAIHWIRIIQLYHY